MTLKLSRILHAGYVFECEGLQLAFDPIFENPFSRNCHAFPDVRFDREQLRALRFAAVFISHFHDDHCSLESLELLDRDTPIYLYCLFEELAALVRELGFVRVYALELDVPVRVGCFEVIARRALDSEVDSMFQVKVAGLNVLNVVDSWIDPATLGELARSGPWDMVLWPFQTMRELEVLAPSRACPAPVGPAVLPPEWLEQLRALQPRYVVPSSCQFVLEPWSWYNQAFFPISYRQFQQEVELAVPGSRVVRLNPSVGVVLGTNTLEAASPLTWIEPVGEQDVDYGYAPQLQPPPTAEIARQFGPLTSAQAERVFAYCRSGLLERYRSMEPPADEYFRKRRAWRLSVYDHRGEVTQFCYSLRRREIERVPEHEGPFSWSTELPLSKLYAALEMGESLTSMYVRINDMSFEASIEEELRSVDILDDPLIRCLFNGVFGAYQRAQLRRLTSRLPEGSELLEAPPGQEPKRS